MANSLWLKTEDGIEAVSVGGDSIRTVQTDASRSAVISAGTAYTVPTHAVGSNRVLVYLDGVLYTDFTDTSITTVTFSDNIPASMEIVVIVD